MATTTRARKVLTPAQQAATDARKEAWQATVQTVSDMSEDARMLLIEEHGAIVNADGKNLSPFNSCLIIMQRPTASIVGGFKQWGTRGRKVSKGAKGIAIWIPTTFKVKPSPGVEVQADAPGKKAGFIMGYVFDIADTEPESA